MKKIIAKEVNPAHVNFSFYFDDDGLKSVSGENCACYIVPADRRRNTGFNFDEYQSIEQTAENIIEAFEEVGEKRKSLYYATYATHKEAMEYCGIPYTSRKCHLLKEWTKTADTSDTDSIAEFLTITTGEEWNTRAFTGYSRGLLRSGIL